MSKVPNELAALLMSAIAGAWDPRGLAKALTAAQRDAALLPASPGRDELLAMIEGYAVDLAGARGVDLLQLALSRGEESFVTLAAEANAAPSSPWFRPTSRPRRPIDVARFVGFESAIYGLAMHPDGRRAIAIGAAPLKQGIAIWDVATGASLAHFDRARVHHAMALFPDGERLAVSVAGLSVEIWDLEKEKRETKLLFPSENERPTVGFGVLAAHPDGKRVFASLMTAPYDVVGWDRTTGKIVSRVGPLEFPPFTLEIDAAGRYLLAATGYGERKVWDLATGACVADIRTGTETEVCGFTFHPARAEVVALARSARADSQHWGPASDLVLVGWDVASGKQVRGPKKLATGGDRGSLVRYLPGGRTLVSTRGIWDDETGWKGPVTPPQRGSAWFVAPHPDGQRVAFGSMGPADVAVVDVPALLLESAVPCNRVVAFDAAGERLLALRGPDLAILDAATAKVLAVTAATAFFGTIGVFSADGKELALTSGPASLDLVDTRTGRVEQLIDKAGGHGIGGAIALHPDDVRIVTAMGDGGLRVWDRKTKRCVQTMKRSLHALKTVAFLGDGARVVVSGADKTPRIWDIDRGKLACSLEGYKTSLALFRVDRSARRAISLGDDGQVIVWNLDDGKPVSTWKAAFAKDLALVSGGTRALAFGSGKLVVWDVAKGKTVAEHVIYEGARTGAHSVAVMQDDRTVILHHEMIPGPGVERRGVASLWDLEQGERARIISRKGVLQIAVGPHGRVAVVEDGGALRLFQLENVALAQTAASHEAPPEATRPALPIRAPVPPEPKKAKKARATRPLVDLAAIKSRGKRAAVTEGDLEALARKYDTELPPGYRDFMERFGPGTYCKVLYVSSPLDAIEQTEQVRKHGAFTAHAGFWPNFADLASIEDAERLVVLATSMDGDELAFVAGEPERLYVFPRHRNEVDSVGPSFVHALGWFSHSGRYWEKATTLDYQTKEPMHVVLIDLPRAKPSSSPWKELVALMPKGRKASAQSGERTYIELPKQRWTLDFSPGAKTSSLSFVFPADADAEAHELMRGVFAAMRWTPRKIRRIERHDPKTGRPRYVPHWDDT